MTTIDLRVRDLTTGVSSLKSFDSEASAIAWLAARPRLVDVLGVATPGIAPELDARLRAALRPLDADEKAHEAKLDAAVAAVARERQEEEQKRARAAEDAHRAAMRTADPNRLLEVHFTYDKGLEKTDPSDPREISDEVREAVLAWVRERDGWVESRGQVVGDAKVAVWPGPLPKGEEERVKRGTFIPVTGPAKKSD